MNIMDALHHAGVTVRKVSTTRGGEYAGACPACGEGRDRFRIWPADRGGEGSYWCRRCRKGGDLVQFLVDFCGYEYKAAFEAAGRSGTCGYIPVRYAAAGQRTQPAQQAYEPMHRDEPVQIWQTKAGDFVNLAHHALLEYEPGLKYLDARGISMKTVKRFRLGWHPGEKDKACSFRPRKSWGLPEIINKKTGRPKMLWLPRGIVIPCYRGGGLHRIKIRRPHADVKTDTDVKYYILPGSGMEVFSAGSSKAVAVIVEAELDAMLIAQEAGGMAGVVALGSASMRPGSSVFYALQACQRVLVALDYDQAGLGKSGWQWWKDNFANAQLWPVPDGKDPGEAWEKGIDIASWVIAGLPASQRMTAVDMGYRKPEGITSNMVELEWLLGQYPITILATMDVIEVQYNPIFKNQGVKLRVNELLAADDNEIAWYLRLYHPDDLVCGKNFSRIKNKSDEV